jgi:uncharacterized protein
MDIQHAEEFILAQQRKDLPSTLYYHGIHHVLDVVEAALRLAQSEQITDEESLALIRTAALYHDCGFMTTYQAHEEEGCRYARETLPRFGYSNQQIDQICGMIRATQIPQAPQNRFEQILCDADLDYLGRDDFEPIARTLYEELKVRNYVPDERAWNRVQVRFLESHRYWTPTAVAQRQPQKEAHLNELKRIVSQYAD